MDPRRLLIFREVARSGSISAAARALSWTQPAVSQHLGALEREAGCPLLLRSPRGVELTEPGLVLLARADAIAGQLHMAEEEMATLANLRGGRVRLAAYPSAAATLVPSAVAALRCRHPDVEVELTQAEPPEAVTMVQAGEADLALVFSYDEEPIDHGAMVWRSLGSEAVDLVVPPGHPLARTRAFSVRDLADEKWVVGCERCRAHAVALCAAASFEPDVRHVSDDYVVVQNLVAVGLGIALLPRSALEAFRHPDVEVRRSRALGSRSFGMLHPPGAQTVPATAALVAALSRR